MISAEHNAFRNLKLSELERYLATLIDSKRFNLNDLEPFGLLSRIASQFFALYTFADSRDLWIIENDGLLSHPFTGAFFSMCSYAGTSIDMDDPELRRPMHLADRIRRAMGEFIAENGDDYVFVCGGRVCRYAAKHQAVYTA